MKAINKWVDENFLKKSSWKKSEIQEIIAKGHKDLFYSIKKSKKRIKTSKFHPHLRPGSKFLQFQDNSRRK